MHQQWSDVFLALTHPYIVPWYTTNLWHFNSLRPSDAYKCIGKLTIIGSDNCLSPGRRQPIIWTNAGILLIGPSGTNFSKILIAIESFSFRKMHLKISSAKWRQFCLGLNVLTNKRHPIYFPCGKTCSVHWTYVEGYWPRYMYTIWITELPFDMNKIW